MDKSDWMLVDLYLFDVNVGLTLMLMEPSHMVFAKLSELLENAQAEKVNS